MSTEKQINIGVIGAGNIGGAHMRMFHELEETNLLAVSDVYAPLAESRAKQFEIPKIHQTPQALIEDPDIDAIVVGVPNKFHADLTVAALQAGKHVLLEKPMGVHVEDARRIVRAQRETGNIVMIAHQKRWEKISQMIKEQVEKGELGDIYTAKTGWFRRKGIPGWGTWFTQKEVSGGGPLIDIGVHMLDLSLHLMGSPKPVSVYGATYAEFGPKKRGIGTWGKPNWDGFYDVEDFATALIKMDNGSTLTLEVSWAVHMDTDNQPFVHLMGSEGGATIRGAEGKFLTERFDQSMEVSLTPPSKDSSREGMTKHFLECIRAGKQPLTSAQTGLANNLILDAIYESSKTGHEVILDWNV